VVSVTAQPRTRPMKDPRLRRDALAPRPASGTAVVAEQDLGLPLLLPHARETAGIDRTDTA